MPKKNSESLDDFLARNTTSVEDIEDVETLNLERDMLHAILIKNHHTFEGKFGPAVVVTYENEDGTFKAYFGGFEVTHFNNFIAEKELPLRVQLARVQKPSASNEGRTYNQLVIEEV